MGNLDSDFERLMELFQGIDPAAIPVTEVLGQTVRFFEKMQGSMEGLTPEKKMEMGLKLAELAQKFSGVTKPFIEKTGLSEEQLFALMENPAPFNEEQWKLMQESKNQVTDSAKKIASALKSFEPADRKVDSEIAKTEKKKPIQPPRSTWMKS